MQPEGELDAISFAFVVPDCEPGNRLSVIAPDGVNLMIPCPANVKPGMKLVLNKNQEGVWRIAHATEASIPPAPAKFSVPPSSGQNTTTPTRAPLQPLLASASANYTVAEERSKQTPCWAEPRQEEPVDSTPLPNGIQKEDASRNSTGALVLSPEREEVRNRPARSSRPSGSKVGRSPSPKSNPSSSRDSGRKDSRGTSNKARTASSPSLSGRTANAGSSGRSPSSGNRRSLPTQASPDRGSSRSLQDREADKLKDLIRAVYQRKNPAKLAELDALFEKHKGDEKGIYEHVCRKYGETPRPWSSKP
jgi:hypothetical protein